MKKLYLLLLALSFFVVPQEEETNKEEVEEVVVSVTGTIASLKSGIEKQRKSNQVVSVVAVSYTHLTLPTNREV